MTWLDKYKSKTLPLKIEESEQVSILTEIELIGPRLIKSLEDLESGKMPSINKKALLEEITDYSQLIKLCKVEFRKKYRSYDNEIIKYQHSVQLKIDERNKEDKGVPVYWSLDTIFNRYQIKDSGDNSIAFEIPATSLFTIVQKISLIPNKRSEHQSLELLLNYLNLFSNEDESKSIKMAWTVDAWLRQENMNKSE